VAEVEPGREGAVDSLIKICKKEKVSKMNIFIPIENKTGLDALVDNRMGRAEFFLIYDLKQNRTVSIEKNQFADAQHGVGIKVANHIVSSGCSVLLGASAGPKAAEILETAGIQMFDIRGLTAKQAIDGYRCALAGPTKKPFSIDKE
jgi:predicted Fe-Mo cluster-binding NifX family protein